MSLLTKFDQGAVRVGFILEQVCMFFCAFSICFFLTKRNQSTIYCKVTKENALCVIVYIMC